MCLNGEILKIGAKDLDISKLRQDVPEGLRVVDLDLSHVLHYLLHHSVVTIPECLMQR